MKKLLILPILFLAACSASAVQSIETARVDIQNAINLYGFSKGVAMVAEAANPSLKPTFDAIFVKADPIVAKAQVALTDASADATAIEALVVQIRDQANALTVQAAPSVKVVGS